MLTKANSFFSSELGTATFPEELGSSGSESEIHELVGFSVDAC